MDLYRDFADLLAAFAKFEVRYLVIGGYAVALHGRPRFTKDLDIWLAASPENRQRATRALAEFGAPLHIFASLANSGPDDVVWFGAPPLRIDLLQTVSGVTFEECWQNHVKMRLGETEVNVLALADLVASKLAAGRPQDLLDIAGLQAK